MNADVEHFTGPFSQWARHVQHVSFTCPMLYVEGSSHPFSSTACIASCGGLLEAVDRHHLGKECCDKQLSSGVFRMLGEGTAASWEVISDSLAHRVGEQTHDPAWLDSGPEGCTPSIRERLERACCSGEVAVLMLQLAVRTACFHSSWYGPWDSLEPLQQLVEAEAWSSLLHALTALLDTLGANLARQYNAINIVCDILHVSLIAVLTCFPGRFMGAQCRSVLLRNTDQGGAPRACAGILQPERASHAPRVRGV